MLPASQASLTLSLSLKPFLLKGILDWCAGMKLTPILMVAPHPDRQLPARIAHFPDFLAFNMSPRSIGDLVITSNALQFVTRLAGSETIERVSLPIGCWHSVRVRETDHRFSLFFPETLLTAHPAMIGDTTGGPAASSQEKIAWWPNGVDLMMNPANPETASQGSRTTDGPGADAFGARVSLGPPDWDGLISATQADNMRPSRKRAIDELGRDDALNVARRRWGGAMVVNAGIHLPGDKTSPTAEQEQASSADTLHPNPES